jgi:hypothetical protein
MDAVNIDIDPEAESFQHTSLRILDVCGSRVEDPEAVARIIFSMLPSIQKIDYLTDTQHSWLKVNEFLRYLAETRTAIRRWSNDLTACTYVSVLHWS